jgi:hypothetical protein
MSYVTHTIIDHSGETSFTRHYLPDVTAANYAAVTGNTALQNVGALRLALGAITDGNFVKHEVTAVEGVLPTTIPASDNAQREIKLLVRYVSSAARRGSLEIPAPDLSILALPDTDLIDETAAEWLAFVSQFQALCRDSYGDTVTVTDGRIVGRRL